MAICISKRKTHQTGNSPRHRIYFEAVFDGEPTPLEVADAQQALGYHPGGYGGPQSVGGQRIGDGSRGDGRFMVTWWCAASSD